MSNDYTDAIKQALIRGNPYTINIDAIVVSHSAWPEPLRFVRNYVPGGTITYAGNVYRYLPMSINRAGQNGNLEQSWTLTLQDLNQEIQALERKIPLDSDEYAQIEISTLEYDKRTGVTTLIEGPYVTDTDSVQYAPEGASLTASAERVNVNGTGVKMTPDIIPTLRPLMQ